MTGVGPLPVSRPDRTGGGRAPWHGRLRRVGDGQVTGPAPPAGRHGERGGRFPAASPRQGRVSETGRS